MRGGLVAVGGVFVVLGLSWWVVLTVDNGSFLQRVAGVNYMASSWLVCMVPLIFLALGGMVFLAGLVGKSQAELAAMRMQYATPYAVAPPTMVVVQRPPGPPQPHLGQGVLRRPPPPPL